MYHNFLDLFIPAGARGAALPPRAGAGRDVCGGAVRGAAVRAAGCAYAPAQRCQPHPGTPELRSIFNRIAARSSSCCLPRCPCQVRDATCAQGSQLTWLYFVGSVCCSVCCTAKYKKQEDPFWASLALAFQESACACWQMPEFRQRVDVLRRLSYVAADNTVQLKARCSVHLPVNPNLDLNPDTPRVGQARCLSAARSLQPAGTSCFVHAPCHHHTGRMSRACSLTAARSVDSTLTDARSCGCGNLNGRSCHRDGAYLNLHPYGTLTQSVTGV